jgi:hypothetical protein
MEELFDGQDSHVENVRVRTNQYEMIVSSVGSYTLAVFQDDPTNKEVIVGASV